MVCYICIYVLYDCNWITHYYVYLYLYIFIILSDININDTYNDEFERFDNLNQLDRPSLISVSHRRSRLSDIELMRGEESRSSLALSRRSITSGYLDDDIPAFDDQVRVYIIHAFYHINLYCYVSGYYGESIQCVSSSSVSG